MKDSARFRCGPDTPHKQKSFRQALGQRVGIASRIRHRGWSTGPFLYVDMNAGPGVCPYDRCPHDVDEPCSDLHGSPRVALRLLDDTLPGDYRAVLFEADPETRAQLAAAVNGWPLDRVLLGESGRFIQPEGITAKSYGVVYVDPSNADLPVDVLQEYAAAFPKVDILINLACTSHKRLKDSDDYERLNDTLARIGKTRWAIREPLDRRQWAMLLGANWQPAHPPSGDWRYLDTEQGRQWFERIVYTREELEEGAQRDLFDL